VDGWSVCFLQAAHVLKGPHCFLVNEPLLLRRQLLLFFTPLYHTFEASHCPPCLTPLRQQSTQCGAGDLPLTRDITVVQILATVGQNDLDQEQSGGLAAAV